ncbi:MAG: DUF3419 family protein [Deltaproteobacteria bacterium]|nr:DUF3419 family protein [Deltaproteobacteria bacterium]
MTYQLTESDWFNPGNFTRELRYGSCSEDVLSEIKALKIEKNGRVLAVTGGGGRVLGLLTEDPAEIVAVDINIHQSRVLKLKIAAMKALNHREFLVFLGWCGRPQNRDRLWMRVRENLDSNTASYWQGRIDSVREGILYSGTFERSCRKIAGIFAKMNRRKRVRLYASRSLAQQIKFLPFGWRMIVAISQRLLKFRRLELFFSSSGRGIGLIRSLMISIILMGVLFNALRSQRVRNSHFLQLILVGRYVSARSLPRYLQPEFYESIQSRLDRIRVREGRVDEVLKSYPAGYFDGISLSNVPAFLVPKEFLRLMRIVWIRLAPAGRVVYRQFVLARRLNRHLARRFARNDDLEAELMQTDLAMGHGFFIGTRLPLTTEEEDGLDRSDSRGSLCREERGEMEKRRERLGWRAFSACGKE